MSTKLTSRRCPVCLGSQAGILHHQRFVLLEGNPLPDCYDVVLCGRCGFAYADTTGTDSDYDAYYADHSKYADQGTSTGGGGNAQDEARLQAAARTIAGHVTGTQARIVDIGCANGGLLAALKALGYARVFGIDPSPACVRNCRELFDVPAAQGWLLDLPREAAPASVVIVSHVLEHVLDLRAATRAIRDLLEPEGLVYVEVPDAGRYADHMIAPFQDFNTEHINHFGAASLENLMRVSGFVPVESGTRTIESAGGLPYPVRYGFYRKAELPAGGIAWVVDDAFARQLGQYIEASRRKLDDIRVRLAGLAGPFIVWGTGQLTMKLLAERVLDERRIAVFVDGNPINHGRRLQGIEIVGPDRLRLLPRHPVVLGTLLHHEAIARTLREGLKLDNPVIKLA